jgi:hypothetical protein
MAGLSESGLCVLVPTEKSEYADCALKLWKPQTGTSYNPFYPT